MQLNESNTAKRYRPAGDFFGWLLSIVALLPLLLFSIISHAAPVIIIDESVEKISLNQYVDILDDADQALSIDQILDSALANQFSPIDLSDRLAIREYSNHFWLRFSIHNTTTTEQVFWLYANESSVRSLNIFRLNSHSHQPYVEIADALFKDQYLTPILKEIHIPANSTVTFLSRVNALNKHASNFKIIKSSRFLSQQVKETRLFTFGLGLLCFLALTSFFFAIYRKSVTFLYHCCFVLSHIGIEATGIGITRDWYPNFADWKYTAVFCFFYLSTATGLMGSQLYIKASSSYSRHYNYLSMAQYFNFSCCLILIFIIDAYSPLILLPLIVAVPTILAAFYNCYTENNDRIAFGIFLSLALGSVILTISLFFTSYSFGLHQFIQPSVVYALIFADTAFGILLAVREYKLIDEEFHHKLLVSINTTRNKAQQELLSEVSHDIRTPISGIMGMADLLRLSSLTSNQMEKVDAIKSSGQALLDKVSEIHYRVQLQQNSATVQKHPFELPVLIETCINSFRMQAEAKNIELISHVQSDVPAVVSGDELRLRQILIKLIDNAIKNTNQGEVLLKVSKLASNPNYIHFSIKDTGRGMTPQDIAKLNLEGNTQTSTSNDRLGIPTTKKLLEQLKSELAINSHIGEGSEFHFSLLLPQASHISSDNNRALHKILTNRRLLVVDDNHTCCKVLKQQATSWGMSVTEAYNGNEALAMFRAKMNLNEPFDAIIIDFDMPHLSGIEVAERILTETDSPPIMIMLTGLSVAPPEHIAHKAGIATVLSKPASEKLIRLTLANLFQEQAEETTEANSNTEVKKPRILVAEDNDVSRGVISKMIENLGVEYKLVSNGQLAVDAAKRERFDLILMDCKMPIMDGYEATRKIHEWQLSKHQEKTPVIALTAYMPDENKAQREQAGMKSYLEKPIVMAELEAMLKLHTRKHSD